MHAQLPDIFHLQWFENWIQTYANDTDFATWGGGVRERFSTCNESKTISSVDMSFDIDQVNSAACRNSFLWPHPLYRLQVDPGSPPRQARKKASRHTRLSKHNRGRWVDWLIDCTVGKGERVSLAACNPVESRLDVRACNPCAGSARQKIACIQKADLIIFIAPACMHPSCKMIIMCWPVG